ncbi:MAG TPA: FAD:protein FMN transferase [Pelobium sp.]|nr:FAD:protein FMN transferase [Pelobium sp.]
MKINNKETSLKIFLVRNFFVVLCLFGLLFCSSFITDDSLKHYSLTGFAQGTSYHINYYGKQQSVSKIQVDSILAKIDSSLSIYKSYSLITAFNESKTGVQMDSHFEDVITKSFEISKKSKGAFDITVYPLVNAWGFGLSKPKDLPNSTQIKALLKDVGYQHLKIKNNKLVKDRPNVKIDVNGIAQGYSVDIIADFLEAHQIYNYVIELGGELRVKGKKTENEYFKIGIEAVNDEDFLPIKKYIEIDEGAITTSGNYRKFYQSGNQKVNHLIDPKTGNYLQNDLISVTVYAKNAITADGYDNVLMTLGLKKALQFLAKHKELSAYFVYTENGVTKDTCSAGFPQIKEF